MQFSFLALLLSASGAASGGAAFLPRTPPRAPPLAATQPPAAPAHTSNMENTDTVHTETLIVGGGMAGTATAFALGEQNVRSVLVERGETLAPPTASSNGDSRMYRKMYSDEFFSKMQILALERWKYVEQKAGQTLLQKNGLLFYGEDTGETVEGSVAGAKQTMENLGLDHHFYASGDDIAAAYPALQGCAGRPYSGVYEEDAGHIRASAACAALAGLAADSGHCEVRVGTKVVALNVNSEGGKVTATTDDGRTIHADNVVVCAGPWTNDVLALAGLPQLNLKMHEIQWGHYRVKTSVARSIPQAFHFRNGQCKEDGGLYYVFPSSTVESVTDGEDYTHCKVGVDFPTEKGDLDNMDTFEYGGSEKVLQLMDGWVQEHLPDVGERVEAHISPYTMTEDGSFVMDKIHDNVAVFSGGSGRAFKFGPLIGECMASLVGAGDGALPIDLARFSASRDAVAMDRQS